MLLFGAGCSPDATTSDGDATPKSAATTSVAGQREALFAGDSCTVRAWGGHEYRFCNGLRSFSQAASQCASLGLKLAKIESAQEQEFIRSQLGLLSISWVGGSKPLLGNIWSWNFDNSQFFKSSLLGGTPIGGAYTNWGFAEPTLGNCTMLKGNLSCAWFAEPCDLPAGYVCENPDACPNDPTKTQPGVCGCGVPDVDNDKNGVADCTFLVTKNDDPEVSECTLKVGTRPQSDMTQAAILFMDSLMPFADYLALAQDRRDKTDAIFDTPGLACDILKGDTDGDLVPDSSDACPQTPPLTPTDDRGCTDSARPEAPDSDGVREIVNEMVLIWQHDPGMCDDAVVETPHVVAGYINNTQIGSAFVAGFFRFTAPGACPARLRVEVVTDDPQGWPLEPEKRVLYFEVPSADFGPAYSGGTQVPGVASLILRDETFSEAYQNLWNAMGDSNGVDSAGDPAFSMTIRAMAVYGDGRQSPWSASVPVRPWGTR